MYNKYKILRKINSVSNCINKQILLKRNKSKKEKKTSSQ